MSKHRDKAITRNEFIGLIAALMALNSLAIDIMLPALPSMGAALGVTNENGRQFIISSYMLGYGIGEIAFGPLSDRFGRRKPLLIGVILYDVGAVAGAGSSNFTLILIMRLIQGLGAASTRVVAASVVRDRYSGKAMAEVMSLSIMLFMAIPILAPSIGEVLLLMGPWQLIFIFMALLGFIVLIWMAARLPETLARGSRRPLAPREIVKSVKAVVSNRVAFAYGLASTFMFASLFGFLTCAQQIYVGIYGLGAYFPLAFAGVATLMALASFSNSRLIAVIGMRRLSHAAVIIFTVVSAFFLVLALTGPVSFWVFLVLLSIVMSCFGWATANMNSLSMLPLGEVAGTASSIFGCMQTVGGVLIGGTIGQLFDGSIVPVIAGYCGMGLCTLICILVAEKGHIFGHDEEELRETIAAS